MLGKLNDNGYRLGIVTSKLHDTEFEGRRIGCAGEMENMGILDMFCAVVGLEDVQKPKPEPECIFLASSHTGIDPRETLVVGDTAADIQAGKSANCVTCRAIWGITESAVEPINIKADFTASKPEDIIHILKNV